MQLLVAVINESEKLDEILSGFLELGITGATIINSEGMGRVLSHDIPIFAGLQTLIARSRPQNQTLFSVIKEEEKVEGARPAPEICGTSTTRHRHRVHDPGHAGLGLKPELGPRSPDRPPAVRPSAGRRCR